MTPAEFKVWFPEFTSEDDERVQLFLDNSDPWFNTSRWGAFYPEGVANFVAHQLTLANWNARNATKGRQMASNLSKEKAGEVEVMYDAALLDMQANNPYMRTTYGQRYYQLAQMIGTGGVAV